MHSHVQSCVYLDDIVREAITDYSQGIQGDLKSNYRLPLTILGRPHQIFLPLLKSNWSNFAD
jgi:hypothetical protein